MSAWAPLDGLTGPGEAAGTVRDGTEPPADALLTVDDAWRIVALNRAAQQLFGRSAAELAGQPLSALLTAPPSPAASAAAAASGAAHANGLVDSFGQGRLRRARERVSALHASGRRFDLEINVSPLEAGPGAAAGHVVLLRDVGEREGVEAALQALQRRIRAIFELAPVAIWITEGDRIVFVNRACLSLFGATEPESLLGQSLHAWLQTDAHGAVARQMAQALLSGGRVPTVREHITRVDGSLREVEIAIAALPDHGRTALQMVITDVTQQLRESAQLEQSRQELQRLSASLVEAREEERRRIARELHDELGQQLSALKMEVSALRAAPHSALQAERLQGMLEMIDETVASVRRIAADLRPLMLDDLGLNAAVEWLARMSSRRMGLQITLRLGEYPEPLAERASIALYRMVQESLTNIARHAQASEALVEIKQVAGELWLTVEDNGVGFRPRSMHKPGSHGLMGMRERCHMLGGTLEIGASASGGGRISVRLPLAAGTPGEQPALAPHAGGAADGQRTQP